MENILDFIVWAADHADIEVRADALTIIKNIVEAVYYLYPEHTQEVYDTLPWFEEVENIYVFYFG